MQSHVRATVRPRVNDAVKSDANILPKHEEENVNLILGRGSELA